MRRAKEKLPGAEQRWRAAGVEFPGEEYLSDGYERIGEKDMVRCLRIPDGLLRHFLPHCLFPVLPEDRRPRARRISSVKLNSTREMKTNTTSAPATAPATAEMFAHEWNDNGVCQNPEKFPLDGIPKGACAVFFVGMGPDNLWRAGYDLNGAGEGCASPVVLHTGESFPTRPLALLNALAFAEQFFAKRDKRAGKVVRAVRLKLEAEQRKDCSPANTAEESPVPTPEPLEIACEAVEANPDNPRKEFSQDYLDELAASIESEGLLQRIGVFLMPPKGDELPGVPPASRFRLLYGECRLRAVRQLGRKTIRAEVYPATITPRQVRRITQVENLKRRNLNPVEEAQGYADLMRDFGLTQDDVAKEVGKSRPVIANAIRLLELPAGARELLAAGALTAAHGTALARFKAWPAACDKIAQLALKRKVAAGTLEKNLPFGEELASAGLAVDLLDEGHFGLGELDKKLKGAPGFFIWENREEYYDYAFALDLDAGKKVLAELKAAEEKRAARRTQQSGGGEDGEDGGGRGAMTPAQKREAQKKKNENLACRLGNDALHFAGLERVKKIRDVDDRCVAIVVRETLRHAMGGYGGWDSLADLAKALGITWPKRFAEDDLDALATLESADLLRLAAAAIGEREYLGAMRNAFDLQDDLAALADCKQSDAAGMVEAWKKQVAPLVAAGKTAEEITQEIGCPEFLATNLRRMIRREAREASEIKKDVAEVKAKAKKPAAAGAKKKTSKRAIVTDATRAEVKKLTEAGRTEKEIAKLVGIGTTTVSNIKKALGLVKAR